ncbi:MAG TPA: TRAM domain-containing protein [Chthoniobacterales bacterium]
MSASEIIEITDVAFGGKAVGRLADGRVCFVADAVPGERVEVSVIPAKKRFTEGELVRVVEASPRRVKPPCPYYGTCGGCSYQHIDYGYQIELKTGQVRQTLRRLGGIDAPEVRDAVASPLPYGYRNRITVHRVGGRVGFHRRDGKGLVDIERCLLGSERVNQLLTELRQERFREGARPLREHRERYGFHQTNDAVAALLLAAVDAACAGGGATLIDAYCGDGFFANRLASKFERVVGIEWNERSVAQARERAAANESYLEGDVGDQLGDVLATVDGAGVTVILDPPAQGVDARVLDLLTAYPVARILYVSCNPATLARDVKGLANSYRLVSATPFDMFPQTAEIEVLAELARVE